MSENSTGTIKADLDSQEPSMEDILASIRKIISDDAPDGLMDPQVPLGVSSLGIVPDLINVSDPLQGEGAATSTGSDAAIGELSSSLFLEEFDSDELDKLLSFDDADDTFSDLEIPQSEAEDLIAVLGDESVGLEVPVLKALDVPVAPEADLELSPFSVLDALDNMGGMDSSLDVDLISSPADDLSEDVTAESTSDLVSLNAADLEFLMSDLVSELDETASSSFEAEDIPSAVLESEPMLSSMATPEMSTSSEDINLVKSLMADLTDDSFLDLEDLDLNTVSESTISEGFVSETALDESEASILDDVLTLTINDEILLSEDDIQGIEPVQLAVPVEMPVVVATEPEVVVAISEPEMPAEIEAVAEVKIEPEIVGMSALAALAMRASTDAEKNAAPLARESILDQVWKQDALDDANADMPETVGEDNIVISGDICAPITNVEDILVESDPLSKDKVKETPEMQRAIRSDAILNEVTEEAASDAFAALNHVVEEKAVFAERGDRIGDLVLEALRPMLKDWLDGNLKGIVERAVAKEVKRISTGK